MKTIRWGIVGPGIIAKKFAKAMENVEGAQLVAVASRSEERGKAFAAAYGIPKVFCGYEEMVNAADIDAVYVATAHPFHKPCAEIFLRGKKHVLCEKPLCVNAAEARSLAACARENGVFLMEAMWTRFLPAIEEACDVVKRGEIGDVLDVRADFCYATTPEEEAKLFQKEMAGGSLLDVGVYGLHFVSLFLGAHPTSCEATALVENGVDVHTKVLLTYPGGATASVSSAVGLRKPEEAYIYGTKGYIYMPSFYGTNEFIISRDGREEKIRKPAIGAGFEEEIYEVCQCIRAGKTESARLPLSESIQILSLMDQIRNKIGVRYPFEV